MLTLNELKKELTKEAFEDAKATLDLKIYGCLFFLFILFCTLFSKINNVILWIILLMILASFYVILLVLHRIIISQEKIFKEYKKIIADEIKDYPEQCRELALELWDLKRYYSKHSFKNFNNPKFTKEFSEDKQSIAKEYDELKKKHLLLLELQQSI